MSIQGSDNNNLTIVDIIQQRAIQHPDRLVYTFLHGETAVKEITYKELDQRIRAVAGSIQKKSKKGDRALLLFEPGLDFIIAFYACLYAGVIAVPAYLPDPKRLNRMLPRLFKIFDDSSPEIILTTSNISGKLKLIFLKKPKLLFKHWYLTDKISLAEGEGYQKVPLAKDEVSFLQYTSGSTGDPKGVMITHGNLIHNSETIHQAGKNKEGDRLLTWLPLYHDMGLIGIVIQTVYSGLSSWIMSPFDFLRNPSVWLRCISRFEISVTGGPNFAYKLCNLKVKEEMLEGVDLSCWKMAYSGAEPIQLEILNEFVEKFRPWGLKASSLYACYGLAESTVFVTGSELGSGIKTSGDNFNNKELVSSGKALLPDTILKIVDKETLKECSTNDVGEIWISSPSVAPGYWNKTEINTKVFCGMLAGDSRTYLRSGDLGFLTSDGELFVTGRLKDVIIINGHNIYPNDLETTAENTTPEIRRGCLAAFSVTENGNEKIVLVAELREARGKSNHADLKKKIQKAVFQNNEASLSEVIFIKQGTISKTTSGKIQRSTVKDLFTARKLEILKDQIEPSAFEKLFNLNKELKASDEVEGLIYKILQDEVQNENLSIKHSLTFYDLGIDSLQVVSIADEISKQFKIELGPAIFWDFKNVGDLISYVRQQQNESVHKQENAWPQNFKDRRNPPSEQVAIVGMAARFPKAQNIDEFWSNLFLEYDVINNLRGKAAGYIDQIDMFDSMFFNISPREARLMDPQQRIALEVSWEALENAGIVPSRLTGTKTGVFFGASNFDYIKTIPVKEFKSDLQLVTGNSASIVSNRISYFLNVNGPSLTIDTACSSSLVALNEAVKAIQSRGCDLAIVGGVNFLLDDKVTTLFEEAGMLSPEGKCYAFDHRAMGYVRGEGCGVIILASKKYAERGNLKIQALIKGIEIGHSGTTNSLTAPSAQAQAELLEKVYTRFKINPETINYFETHGTGTKLGDPIEYLGISKVFKKLSSEKRTAVTYIGSVKNNIGHLESAAGIAGIIKAIKIVNEKTAPKLMNFKRINSNIKETNPHLVMPEEAIKFDSAIIRVAVSSFGFGGMNAHAVIENNIRSRLVGHNERPGQKVLFLSAKNEQALIRYAIEYRKYLAATQDHYHDICDSSYFNREHLNVRLALAASSSHECIELLDSFINKTTSSNFLTTSENRLPYEQSVLNWISREPHELDAALKNVHYNLCNLPTYPFEKKSHWVSSSRSRNFEISRDAFFVRDHLVGNSLVLPGVMHIELMVKTLREFYQRPQFKLENLTWVNPVVVTSEKINLIVVVETLNQDNLKLTLQSGGERTVTHSHCTVNLRSQYNSDTKLFEIKEKFSGLSTLSDIYPQFELRGLKYGPTLRGIHSLYTSDDKALGEVKLSNAGEREKDFILHPTLIDASLGCCIGIKQINNNQKKSVFIPYSVEEVYINNDVIDDCWAYTEVDNTQSRDQEIKKYSLNIFDSKGESLVYFKGVQLKEVTLFSSPVSEYAELVLADDFWSEVPGIPWSETGEVIEHNGRISELKEFIIKESFLSKTLLINLDLFSEDSTFEKIYEIYQLLNEHRKTSPSPRGVLYTVKNNSLNWCYHQMVRGLIHTYKTSSPDIFVKIVSFDESSAVQLKKFLQDEIRYKEDVEVEYSDNKRHIKHLEKISLEKDLSKKTLKEKGVYIISGGTGVIGQTIAQFLQHSSQAKVYILGRKKSEEKKLTGEFVQCDLVDKKSVEKAIREIQDREQKIDGVIHCAGEVSNDGAGKISISETVAKTKAKVSGCIYLDETLKDSKLDFFLVASSISSFMGDNGSGGYSASNNFLNAFVSYRNGLTKNGVRNGKAISINWPLWETGGMSMSADQKTSYEKFFGLAPMPNALGIQSFIHALNTRQENVVVFYGKKSKLDEVFFKKEKKAVKEITGDVTEEIIDIFSRVAAIEKNRIDIDQDLMELGADSLIMMDLLAELIERFGSIYTPEVLFENRNIRKIASLAQNHLAPVKTSVPITEVVDAGESYVLSDLSSSQKSMWFLYQMNKDSFAYNIPVGIKIKLVKSPAQIKRAVEQLTFKHPVLRTEFVKGSHIQQVILDNAGISFKILELNKNDNISSLTLAEARIPFDLENEIPFRAKLFINDDKSGLLVLTAHHIAFDGLSLKNALNDFVNILEDQLKQDYSIIKIDFGFFRHIEKEKKYFSSDLYQQQLNYWRAKFDDEIVPLLLPLDKTRPKRQTYNGASVDLTIDSAALVKIKKISSQLKVTPNAFLFSVFNVFLNKVTHQDEFFVGTPILGRSKDNIQAIGHFVNVVPIKSRIEDSLSFNKYVEIVNQEISQSLANGQLPFTALLEQLIVRRDPSYSPVFQVCFVFQNMLKSKLIEADKVADFYDYFHIEQQEGQFEIELEIVEINEELKCFFKYNTDLFSRERMISFQSYFVNILKQVLADHTIGLKKINILSTEESTQILTDFNNTDFSYGKSATLVSLFESAALLYLEKTALKFNDETLTYKEFNQRSNQLAYYLKERGLKSQDFAGVLLDRSMEMMISIYAIIKAGAAYVPIDPNLPEARVRFILEDSQAVICITSSEFKHLVSDDSSVVFVDKVQSELEKMSTQNLNIQISPDSHAYMIYTSGSTGNPKGVIITHDGICNRLLWMQNEYKGKTEDKFVQKTPITFDVSVWELFWPLQIGATLVILKPNEHRDVGLLSAKIAAEKISIIHFVPSMLNIFLDSPFKETLNVLSKVFCSGEALTISTQNEFFKNSKAELINLYGPTEASVDVSYWKCEKNTSRAYVPIGKPIHNIKLFVLDKEFSPVPVGVYGELCIAGIGLAKGYNNRAELNVERFVKVDIAGTPVRIYRTGDYARYDKDGVIEYLGRIDNQVKVGGVRIELGEIEFAINSHEKIKECIVSTIGNGLDKTLVAYVVLNSGQVLTREELKTYLLKNLPANYIPTHFKFMEAFPVSSNGKVDRKLLPDDFCHSTQKTVKIPGNEMEETIFNCWKHFLQSSHFGVSDNFFDVGGDSLLSIQVLLKINSFIDKNIPLVAFYEYPTIESFCQFISENKEGVGELNLELKSALDKSIHFSPYKEDGKQEKNIFITGVTGFLGAYLLADLIKATKGKVFCLVRARDKTDGLLRIKSNLKKYNLSIDGVDEKVEVIPGDLGKPHLGLLEKDWEFLSSLIDIVYHNGAKVNFLMPYSLLEKENVSGTLEVLKLCANTKSKKLFYVSTVSVFDSSEYVNTDDLSESKKATHKNLFSGYAQSKWVAEELVRTALDRGLAGMIFRPGTITGDMRSGISSVDDLMTRLFLSLLRTSSAPKMQRKFDMIPVDFVSQSIVKLSKEYTGPMKLFHLANPRPVELTKLIEIFRSLNHPIEEFDYWSWVQRLNSLETHPLQTLMTLFSEKVNFEGLTQAQLSERRPAINSLKTNAILKELGLHCPEINKELVGLYLNWCEGVD